MNTTSFTMYDKTNAITRVVDCSTNVVRPPPLRPGEFRIEGRGNMLTQKIVGRQIVDKTPTEMAALKKANPRLRFDKGKEK